MRHGNLFVISGPSGTGKGTLVARLLELVPDAWLSISATSRKPRPGDIDGVTYYFKTPEEFKQLINDDELLEWAVYSDNYYGTPLKEVRQAMQEGKQVILEIDMQGAFQIRDKIPEAHLIFIEPPSFQELERRLRMRGTEDEQTVQKRLEAAKLELSAKEEYDYRLVNDNLADAVGELVSYVNSKAEETRG